MSKIDLNTIEKIGIWVWRLTMAVIVSWVLYNQQNFSTEMRVKYDYVKPLIENTADIVSSNEIQPEIPDADNKEYQASCPAESNILDDPNRMVRFFEAIDPYIEAKPYRLNLLIALLVGNRDRASNYLLEEYSTGFPIR